MEKKAERKADGYVLCCHGRPIRCLECGDEYAAELEAPPAALDRFEAETEVSDLLYANVTWRMMDRDKFVRVLAALARRAFTLGQQKGKS